MQQFSQLNLSSTMLSALGAMGFQNPTPIQTQTIPILFEGRDVIAQARTGTGKTAAFGIPMIEGAAGLSEAGILALVLVPTRELAVQVAEELARLARGTRVRAVAVYGGVGFEPQAVALRHRDPLVAVATPGRLLDHMERGTIRLDGVRMLILDEADRMLDMGFLPDVERILRRLPVDRQTALFSATMPDAIRQLSRRFLKAPVLLQSDQGPTPTPLAEQFRVDVPAQGKPAYLHGLLTKEAPERAIVFTRTKHRARSLARVLDRNGWSAVALQGNMTQSQRERSLTAFRTSKARVLVATDVASRGLDIPDVSHVVNYDLPDEAEAYVHRIGRTARMGRTGRAFTFVQPDQARDAQSIERSARITLQPYEVTAAPVDPVPDGAPSGVRPASASQGRNGGRRFPRRRRNYR